MAGGKKGGAASKKTQQKTNQKIIEDKTFGLKNKNKSQKVQKYVTQVKHQVENGNTKRRDEFGVLKSVVSFQFSIFLPFSFTILLLSALFFLSFKFLKITKKK